MASRLLITSLIGASGVSGLSVSETAVEAKTELKSWTCTMTKYCTHEELQVISDQFQLGQHTTHPTQLPFVHGFMTDEGIDQLKATYSFLVSDCEEDPFVQKAWEKPVPADLGGDRRTYPWGIVDIDADVGRGRGVGVNVYVLDTGIRTTHTLFGGRAFPGLDHSGGALNVCLSSDTTCAADVHGHGTHCAGTVGAATYGVADGSTIWAMKVLNDGGWGYTWWSIDTEQWILTNGARPAVVSMSLGGPTQSTAEQTSIDSLTNDGITVVVAAGNQNSDACNYNPAWIASAITVASYASGGGKSGFSNYGTCIDVWAPGSSILSLSVLDDTSIAINSGTSMACPHVSGLTAIMYHENPTAGTMTAAQRWSLLTASQRTGYVTGIPSTPPTVNLVALSPTPTPATPAPPAPPPPPATPAPTPGAAAAVGDPHMQNVHGERFDLMKPGKHVMLNIPRGMTAENALLRVQADAVRLGEHCADMYFHKLNITGSWVEAKQVGGYQFAVSQQASQSPEWLAFGPMFRKVMVKVVHGVTEGGLKYLNLYVKNLGRVGITVGGLLGEDDHKDVSAPSGHCGREMTLLGVGNGEHVHGTSVASVAAASFD